MMDFLLRCNSLKCRAKLDKKAVVTTCSHIFCLPCTESLNLAGPAGANRLCPACHTSLPNLDDVVATQLNPTEDYKTSVMSGLNPSIIMECAGRGLAFWSYQSTQEIIYQEYLARSLTDKYGNLSVQMDKVINDANAEIDNLNQKLLSMQIEQDRLKTENTDLASAFREKNRKQQQTQELYDRLKRKEMTAATQSAAYQSVDEVLGSVVNHHVQGMPSGSTQYSNPGPGQVPSQQPQYSRDFSTVEQGYSHNRNGSNGEPTKDRMMPPPPRLHASGIGNPNFPPSQDMATPSQHRSRLGPLGQQPAGHINPVNGVTPMSSQNRSPSRRQPFNPITGNSMSKPAMSGYGMSAGLKVGRQHGNGSTLRPMITSQAAAGPGKRFTHPLAHPQHFHDNSGSSSYY